MGEKQAEFEAIIVRLTAEIASQEDIARMINVRLDKIIRREEKKVCVDPQDTPTCIPQEVVPKLNGLITRMADNGLVLHEIGFRLEQLVGGI